MNYEISTLLNYREKYKKEDNIQKKKYLPIKYLKKILSLDIWEKVFDKYNSTFKVKEQNIFIEHLPRSFDNFKILFISDTHLEIEPNPFNEFLKSDLPDHDIVILGGDYFDNPKDYNPSKLKSFISKFKKPVLAIMGNHDDYNLMMELEKLGVRVLINEAIEIKSNRESIFVAGIDEIVHNDNGQQKELLKEMSEKFKGTTVVLSHSPNICEYADALQYDVQLSGHTHGGQFLLFKYALCNDVDFKQTLAGKWQFNNLQGYTSTGLGNSGYPIRNIYPEVALITFKR